MAGHASAVLAAPASGPATSIAVVDTLQPVLKAAATAGGSGAQSLKFYARTAGSSSWDLIDGQTVAGTSGTAQVPAGLLSVQSRIEYRAEHCDTTGCTTSATKSGLVATGVGIGPRPGATMASFTLGDRISAGLDVGSGNLMVSLPAFTLPRVAGDLSVGLVYNSTSRANLGDHQTSISSGWRLSTGSDVYLAREASTGAITYYGPNGLTGVFWPVAGSDAFAAPAGFKMDLRGTTAAGWTLYDHSTGDTRVFNTAGQLTALEDRNGNQTTFTYNGAALTQITGDQGSAGARTLTVTTDPGSKRITTISQAASADLPARSVTLGYDGAGNMTSFTDTLGRVTTLFYSSSGNLNSVTAPGGAPTSLTYDAYGRVQSITQPTAGGGTAVTRLGYPSYGTVLADPNTDQSRDLFSVPRTRYDITADGLKLVAKVTDPAGNAREASYTPFLDVASASDSAGTTNFGYDTAVNGGESLTGVTGATGASSSFSYGNTGPAQFQPSSGTDAQGNASTYSYNGAGNRLSAADAGSNTASVTYNPDGTVATSTSPSGAVTSYTYDGNKQLQTITPPAGSSLGDRSYSYDGFGRLRIYTSGRGVTQTYSYDALDRVTDIDYSIGGTTGGSASYDYNTAGQLTSRVDPSGTTTMTYDPLGRLTSRKHSINDLTLSYSYDKAGNLATVAAPAGTASYAYDSRNLVTRMTLPGGKLVDFGYDADGRRVDSWQGTNAAHTSWDAHTRTSYDAAGRITRVYTARASNDSDRVSDLSYTYTSNGTACSGGQPAGTDTALRQSMTDHTTGRTTTYCYDTANRLTSATTPGGDTFTYTYDANGNRTQQTKNGAVVQTLTVNAADQLTSSGYSYDATGNLLTASGATATYNGAEQMTDLNFSATTTTYTYAGTDQTELVSQTRAGATRTYTYGRTDSNGLPLIEAVTSGTTTSYIAHDPTGSPIALIDSTGRIDYYALDGLGSTVATVDQDGITTGEYSYDPYGKATVTSPTGSASTDINPYRYAGGAYDPFGLLVHFGQRWYDPTTGRFTQQDSLETLADPTHANRYEYAISNPINYVDPTGQWPSWLPDWSDVAGYVAGASVSVTCAVGVITLTGGIGTPAAGICNTVGGFVGVAVGNAADENGY